jgi:hypothetical protein
MGLPAAPGGRLNDMRRGFEPVGKLRTGRPGRLKSLLVGPGGELYTWKRPRGRWRPRALPQRSWVPDWQSKGRGRVRLLRVWKTRKCPKCLKVKDVWPQVVIRWASKRNGRWLVRSFPVRKGEVRHPDFAGEDTARPKVACRCPSNSGVPRRSIVNQLAMRLSVTYDRSGDRPVSPLNPAVW